MGAKYIVFTTKHHGGFANFDSAATDYDVMSTPYGSDATAELVTAMRAEGIKIGFYFSAWDWRRYNYAGMEKEQPGLGGRRHGYAEWQGNSHWQDFQDFYLQQVDELVSNYGDIDILWIDGWKYNRESDMDVKWSADEFYNLVRSKQPDILLNDRWGDDGARVDFITPEGHIPGTDPGEPWETCITANGGWFYKQGGYSSPSKYIHDLIDCVSKNGNMLLAIPQNPEGTYDADAAAVMAGIGDWMDVNGESIYGCGAAELEETPWGSATEKPHHLYLHVYASNHDPDNPIVLEGRDTPIVSAKLLDTDQDMFVVREGPDVYLYFPYGYTIDPIASVVEIQAPEPGALVLISLGGVALLRKRRRNTNTR
jgi:alpha-L-fucosidase